MVDIRVETRALDPTDPNSTTDNSYFLEPGHQFILSQSYHGYPGTQDKNRSATISSIIGSFEKDPNYLQSLIAARTPKLDIPPKESVILPQSSFKDQSGTITPISNSSPTSNIGASLLGLNPIWILGGIGLLVLILRR